MGISLCYMKTVLIDVLHRYRTYCVAQRKNKFDFANTVFTKAVKKPLET